MARLAEHHITALGTDQHGLITFRTDGKSLEWATYRN
jgi:beta-lactamase superfamily II metal-dependent hydrolase